MYKLPYTIAIRSLVYIRIQLKQNFFSSVSIFPVFALCFPPTPIRSLLCTVQHVSYVRRFVSDICGVLFFCLTLLRTMKMTVGERIEQSKWM